jgi:sugar phosphate isomerase/epimerase
MAGTGIWHADLEHILETRTLREVKTILDDTGLRYLELEFLWEWFLDPSDERRRESDRTRELLWEAAAVLEAHHVKVGNIPGTPFPLDELAGRYAELCADAAEHHGSRVVYEFMPFDVNVHDLDSALAVVEGADAPNGGLAIDTWHMSKLGIEPADLLRVAPRHLGWVELSDGLYESMPDLIEETVDHRRLPGEGEFPIRDYVAVCRELGYVGPWGIEVLSEELRNLPIDEIFERAYATASAQLHADHERSTSV